MRQHWQEGEALLWEAYDAMVFLCYTSGGIGKDFYVGHWTEFCLENNENVLANNNLFWLY